MRKKIIKAIYGSTKIFIKQKLKDPKQFNIKRLDVLFHIARSQSNYIKD